MVALVMSGGGPIAVAWEAGLLAGLERKGVSFSDAEMVLGTSAGAIVGSQLRREVSPEVIVTPILEEAQGNRPNGGPVPFNAEVAAQLPSLLGKAQAPAPDQAGVRREIGRYALSVPAEDERVTIARFAFLVGESWPHKSFGCVAVNTATGAAEILTKNCGASLAAAVAASCSLPGYSAPITIGGQRYIDGGFASTANADLATGFKKVVVFAFHRADATGPRVAEAAQRQAGKLRERGAKVLVVHPDEASLAHIGADVMGFHARPAVAEAAIKQGVMAVAEIAEFLAA
jgi:NTE family protein